MKDYYDIYYLATHFEFDSDTLAEAMRKTFANRNHHFTMEQFNQVLAFGEDESMQKKWQAFVKKINIAVDFETVLITIKILLAKSLKVTENKKQINTIKIEKATNPDK